jgi:prepilin-type processing-associated H-X9-DG protein
MMNVRAILCAAVLAVAAGTAHAQGSPSQAVCVNNLKQLSLGTLMFVQDHNQKYPAGAGFAAIGKQLLPYVKNTGLLRCAASGKDYQFNTRLSGVSLRSVKNPDKTPLFRDAAPHADGSMNVAFADGHVKRFPASQAKALGGAFR